MLWHVLPQMTFSNGVSLCTTNIFQIQVDFLGEVLVLFFITYNFYIFFFCHFFVSLDLAYTGFSLTLPASIFVPKH